MDSSKEEQMVVGVEKGVLVCVYMRLHKSSQTWKSYIIRGIWAGFD